MIPEIVASVFSDHHANEEDYKEDQEDNVADLEEDPKFVKISEVRIESDCLVVHFSFN